MLNNCLYCGSDDVKENHGIVNKGIWVGVKFWIECRACGACGGQHDDEESALQAWNQRGGGY
jgi:Lar family restriction alleviation protein